VAGQPWCNDRDTGGSAKVREAHELSLGGESVQWDRTQAYKVTKEMLVVHLDIDGVWTANDDMGMGAIQPLKEAGLAGKALVTGTGGIPEMFDAIKGGLAAATILNDGKY
jgi:ribose transport system substrate-binding protein